MARRDGGVGGRRAAVRVHTARRRSNSSARWLQRQLNDPYVAEARRRGYRSRAAFKLAEIDERFHLLGPGKRVVDLGAAPGGWTQVALAAVRPRETGGKVVAVDLQPMDELAGAAVILGDMTEAATVEAVRQALGGQALNGQALGSQAPGAQQGGQADLVLSDMAAPATGHGPTDHLRVIGLCETALAFAEEVLAPGGAFVAKVLQGGATGTLVQALRKSFAQVRHVKPPASRSDSKEVYVVATGFRGPSGLLGEPADAADDGVADEPGT